MTTGIEVPMHAVDSSHVGLASPPAPLRSGKGCPKVGDMDRV